MRAGFCRQATDWPFSSARELLGLRPAPPWLDPLPLYDLLGPRDGKGAERLRRFMDSALAARSAAGISAGVAPGRLMPSLSARRQARAPVRPLKSPSMCRVIERNGVPAATWRSA